MIIETSILNPDAEVKLSSGKMVTVVELNWKKALVFFGMLEEQVKGMLDGEGKFKFDTSTIFNAIKGNAPLVEWIATHCTNREAIRDSAYSDVAWIETLTLGDMAKLVAKAMEINLRSVADEIKNVKGRLDSLAGGPPSVAGTEPKTKSNPIPLPTANS